jgi:hypothetical protein
MKKRWHNSLMFLFITGFMFTCIDPYNLKLDKFQSLLVVDALITDENISNSVCLSRTIKSADDNPEMVTGALVKITDDLGNSTFLTEKSEGKYMTDSLTFRGEEGRSYKLYIKTSEGEEYESESCLMYPSQDIGNINFIKAQEIVDNETQEGIRIFADLKDENDCNYYRWTFEEWWEISVPFPKLFDYVNEDSIIECSRVNKICYGNNKSDAIIIKSSETGISYPIFFVASDKSERLLNKYCIQVRQLSISKEEYEFWNRMKQISESGGDIFDKQPFQISGNIHNVRKPEELVLGYFQVSGAKLMRRFISKNDISDLDLPKYKYECNFIVVGKDDFSSDPNIPPRTFDELYAYYSNANSIFIEPVFVSVTFGHLLDKLVFATPLCSDCTTSGSLTKPDFWID